MKTPMEMRCEQMALELKEVHKQLRIATRDLVRDGKRIEALNRENEKLNKSASGLEKALMAREDETDELIKAAEAETVRVRGLIKIFIKRCRAHHTICSSPCGIEALHQEARKCYGESLGELSAQMDLEADRRERAERAINVLLHFQDIHPDEKDGLHAAALLLGFSLAKGEQLPNDVEVSD